MKKAQDITITSENIDIWVVWLNQEFVKLSPEEISKYLVTGMEVEL